MTTLTNKTEINRSVLLDVIGSIEYTLWTPLQDFVQSACAAKVLVDTHWGTWDKVRTAVWDFHQDFEI